MHLLVKARIYSEAAYIVMTHYVIGRCIADPLGHCFTTGGPRVTGRKPKGRLVVSEGTWKVSYYWIIEFLKTLNFY